MKKNIEIDISSSLFEPMLRDLNKEIKRLTEKIYKEEFEAGDITLKLSLNILEGRKEIPVEDEYGYQDSEIYWYKQPEFKHSVSTSLKKQFKQKGSVAPEAEIKLINDEYLLIPIEEPQLNFLEKEEDDFLK